MVGDLRNVHQTIHARNDLRERTEGGHADDLDRHGLIDRIVALEDLPRILVRLAIGERDLFLLDIQILDGDLDFLADGQHIRRMLHAVPRQLGDVNHTVHAADVHKRTVGGHRLHHTGVDLTDLGLRPERFFFLFTLLTSDRTDRADRTTTRGVDLDHTETDIRALQRGQIVHTVDRCLRRRHKHADAVGNHQHAALDDVGHGTFQNFAGLGRLHDGVPALHRIHTLLGKHDGAFLIVGAHNEQIQFIADLDDIGRIDIRVSAQFVGGNVTGLLTADDFHLNLVGSDAHNDTVDSFICI